MANQVQIYDFEQALETALKQSLTDAGLLNGYATADAALLDRLRPRFELQFTVAGATDHLALMADTDPVERRHDAFTGSMLVAAITDMASGIEEHMTYRAQVRSVAARFIYSSIDTLEFHEINQFTPAGTTPIVNPSEGIWESRQLYAVHFNIKSTAW
jgi:hypothetical protein